MIERSDHKLSVRRQCWLLSVSQAGLSYELVTAEGQTLQIMRRLIEWYVEHPDLSHQRLVVLLKQEGWAINIKWVRRLGALMDLETQFPSPICQNQVRPSNAFSTCLSGLVIDRIHQVWVTNSTYIPTPKGFLYVMAILDLHNRYGLHGQLSNTLKADWCVETLQQKLQQRGNPSFLTAQAAPTDQGSQFTSDNFVAVLQGHQIAISWDAKRPALDNIFVERFWPVRRWRTLKYEEVHLRNYQTGHELRVGLSRCSQYYNHHRPHQSLGCRQ